MATFAHRKLIGMIARFTTDGAGTTPSHALAD